MVNEHVEEWYPVRVDPARDLLDPGCFCRGSGVGVVVQWEGIGSLHNWVLDDVMQLLQ